MVTRHVEYLELNLELAQEAGMDQIRTSLATSISEFKKNPNSEVAKAAGKPFAVLTNNRPTFYVLPPKVYDQVLEILSDAQMAPLIKKRLKQKKKGVSISLDEL